DGADSEKRSRARHGLDVARSLRELDIVNVTVFEDQKTAHNVDDQLLKLAREHTGSVCTIDYNLNKVAKAEAIRVLNINELAKNLRMNFLPGEKVNIMVTQKGSDAHQGVGYMADGTMVVIEQAKQDIGKMVKVEFIRSIQTDAGRMLFAKKITGKEDDNKAHTAKKVKKRASAGRSPRKAEDALVELANG
ncbi:MAG TPA: TRAM domain-containing protein, partial [Candidatus Saccharimonadales bacterium]